jgi:hypothetical protein
MQIEAKLNMLRLILPEPFKIPPGLHLPFVWVRLCAATPFPRRAARDRGLYVRSCPSTRRRRGENNGRGSVERPGPSTR